MDELLSIDLSVVNSEIELHKVLKEKMEFPDFYGMNWDAFWDAITGLVDLPEKIVFVGWNQFTERLPQVSQILLKLLEDRGKQYPTLKCEIICRK